jgi:sporulation protein YlmC with PRC-barrel domain
MTSPRSTLPMATLALLAALAGASPASAQVAGGTTTVDTSVTESTQLALGWSVKKSLLGKTIYNEAGLKVGKVDDLIVAPDKNLSYVIVGAGGFVGIGRHDVAVPVTRIQMQAGKLVMAGATPEMVKAMPEFTYVNDTARRDQFMAAADKDIRQGKARLAELEKKAAAAAADGKAKLDLQISALRLDLASAEARRDEAGHRGALEGVRGRCQRGHGAPAQVARGGYRLTPALPAGHRFPISSTR